MSNLHRVAWTETVQYAELVELPEGWDDLDGEDQGDWIAENVEDLDAAYFTCEGREILSCDRTSPEDAGAFYELEAGRQASARLRQEREERKQAFVKELQEAVQALDEAEARAQLSGDLSEADALEDEIVPIVRELLPYLR